MNSENLKLPVIALLLTAPTLKAAEPILEWRFDGTSQPGAWAGKYGTPAKGPRSPRYPGFDEKNNSVLFPGHEGWIVIKDHEWGGFTNVRFGAGDAFAFEAWVKVKTISENHMVYLLGKGRHGKHGENVGDMNQNYAVRLKGTDGGVLFGFLFTSEDPETKKRDWHRWWSKGQVPLTGWHHLAFVFTFGKADSLRAYIDNKPVEGVWDLGGATNLPPVQDVDDLAVGSGYNRLNSTSFFGWMDNIALYREPLSADLIAKRYAYVPPPPPVTRVMIPAGKVLIQISEDGVPEVNTWPEEPLVTETYQEEVFGLFELPHKYVSTGVRADRANPSLLRASALVTLPAGKHRLLLRGRGMTRLIIDGMKLLETPRRPGDPAGHGLLSAQDKYLDLGPEFRFVPPGNRERWCEFETKGREHFVIVEAMVGGMLGKNKQRPELGETVVAISLEGSNTWSLLSPGKRKVSYTDTGWAAYEAERCRWLATVNARARAARRAANEGYWSRRRSAAKEWLSKT
ncbi:MAG: hypothetical protein QF473_02790 [Planctomycetota bacterium]|nr:hypothetical protein [Planctomycetota bacterium]